jgi:hypothetical protein
VEVVPPVLIGLVVGSWWLPPVSTNRDVLAGHEPFQAPPMQSRR